MIEYKVFLLLFTIQKIYADLNTTWIDYEELGGSASYSFFLNRVTDLYNEIFTKRSYQINLAPINSNATIDSITLDAQFEIAVKLQRIYTMDLDMSQQIIELFVELELVWLDIRLAWDPVKFDGLQILFVSCQAIWAPEEFIISAPSIDEVAPDRFKQCKVYANGSVHYDMFLRLSNVCPMHISRFPFDSQKCAIQFSSNQYQYYRLRLFPQLFTKYAQNDVASNGEWLMTNVSSEIVRIGGGDRYTSDVINFWITAKRKPNYYIYVIALPCFLLTFLSIIGCFWKKNLPEEQLEKLAIALTSMMSMTTFVEMVSEQMPKTAEFPLLGIFVLTCVFIVSLSCVILVIFTEKKNLKHQLTQNEQSVEK